MDIAQKVKITSEWNDIIISSEHITYHSGYLIWYILCFVSIKHECLLGFSVEYYGKRWKRFPNISGKTSGFSVKWYWGHDCRIFLGRNFFNTIIFIRGSKGVCHIQFQTFLRNRVDDFLCLLPTPNHVVYLHECHIHLLLVCIPHVATNDFVYLLSFKNSIKQNQRGGYFLQASLNILQVHPL